jgi:hypothetical protein
MIRAGWGRRFEDQQRKTGDKKMRDGLEAERFWLEDGR